LKMHGCGNDFVLVDETKARILEGSLRSKFAEEACDRHRSIGADGVVFLRRAKKQNVAMAASFFMPDGSEAEMCGNAVRCISAYAVYAGISSIGKKLDIVTMGRTIRASVINQRQNVFMVEASLGKPKLAPQQIPISAVGESFIGRKILVPVFGEIEVTALNTGVPHTVIFVDDVQRTEVERLGRAVRHMREIFPRGTNVNFVESNNGLKIRTYERGVEHETLSCGTGIAASVVAAYLTGRVKANKPVATMTKGGRMVVRIITKKGKLENVVLTGPAEIVFQGETWFHP
jgi:diaminopimelate epimerase